ncbi:hypothetical protein V6M85_07785 [Sulfolobus tengchongensis]|uniref:Uncharacterized protein n=1 Tax=Sulfolobus tengchongensis TaxID=207809 RepID=A0AAX4KWZ7_9CREN
MSRSKVRNHALYFLGVLTYILALIPFFNINIVRAIILIPIIAYTLPIMEYIQPRIMAVKVDYKDILLIIVTLIPYIFMPFNVYLAIPASLLILTFGLYLTKNTMWGNVLGTTFEVSLSIVWGTFIENHNFLLPAIYWILYIFTGALYVEYKIPFRKLDKRIVQISWIISIIVLLLLSLKNPLPLLTLIEPSIRYLKPGEKLKSPKEIKDLGKRGSRRDIIFIILLAITFIMSTMIHI